MRTLYLRENHAATGLAMRPAIAERPPRIPLATPPDVWSVAVNEGAANKEIAQEVFLSDKTVKNYVGSILSKLHLERRAQVAVIVARHRIDLGD